MTHSIRMKLQVWIVQLECGNLMHFPKLNEMPNFIGVLHNIQTQFKIPYESIEKLEIWFSVFDTPFTYCTYLCEQAFSVMKLIKTQHKAGISDNNLRYSLGIFVSNNIHPDFKDMIKQKRINKLTE
ncbi:hypothetical protein C0J52_13036 [Blattella germanica]|nr:hypothetical protein C0J52_13036 [Blattella germanica]